MSPLHAVVQFADEQSFVDERVHSATRECVVLLQPLEVRGSVRDALVLVRIANACARSGGALAHSEPASVARFPTIAGSFHAVAPRESFSDRPIDESSASNSFDRDVEFDADLATEFDASVVESFSCTETVSAIRQRTQSLLRVSLSGLTALLINDEQGRYVPLINCALEETNLTAKEHDGVYALDAQVNLAANYFNPRLAVWVRCDMGNICRGYRVC